MTHLITIETQNDIDFVLVKSLILRLGLSMKEQHLDKKNISEIEQMDALRKFAGSWKGDETSEDLEALIYGSRNDTPRSIEL
jgi:hypothetical protein